MSSGSKQPSGGDAPPTVGGALVAIASDWAKVARLGVLFLILIALVCVAIPLLARAVDAARPHLSVAVNKGGSIVISSAHEERTAMFLLSANGGNSETPWVNTYLRIRENEPFQIRASGRVCLAMHHMVMESGLNDTPSDLGWSDAEGQVMRPDVRYSYRARTSCNVAQGEARFGRLIGYISYDRPPLRVKKGEYLDIGAERWFGPGEAGGRRGYLWLTVNDSWIDGPKDRPEYAKDEPKQSGSARAPAAKGRRTGGRAESAPPCGGCPICKTCRLGCASDTSDHFDAVIRPNGYWNVWYDDNAGSFLVTVEFGEQTEKQRAAPVE